MSDHPPKIVVLAGPNGAGKSTAAPHLLRGVLDVKEFVNADTIAQGLSAFAQEGVAIQAGRIMLQRLDALAAARGSFGFETTLATRSYATKLRRWQALGYEVHLIFLWLPTAELAVARVADRVRFGGHGVPEVTIRRRYAAGLLNLQKLYIPLVDSWNVIDNSNRESFSLIASGLSNGTEEILRPEAWALIQLKSKG